MCFVQPVPAVRTHFELPFLVQISQLSHQAVQVVVLLTLKRPIWSYTIQSLFFRISSLTNQHIMRRSAILNLFVITLKNDQTNKKSFHLCSYPCPLKGTTSSPEQPLQSPSHIGPPTRGLLGCGCFMTFWPKIVQSLFMCETSLCLQWRYQADRSLSELTWENSKIVGHSGFE